MSERAETALGMLRVERLINEGFDRYRIHINISSAKRDFGIVFQSYAIWPHMNVYHNVSFPLVHGQSGRLPRKVVRERVMKALELTQLEDLAERLR